MELYLAVFIGALLYVLFSLNEAKAKEGFEWKIYVKENWIISVINLIVGWVLVWLQKDISMILPMTGLVAIYVGWGGQSILKRIFKMFDKKVDTIIGN